ncbi:MAG TPA: efflux RND transporter periplasmic adaptor subunit [Gemmatimonadaceae bacterium]|nr:efflux RND transporter periplasmic adaptor subunit [Gemmatimonadaceae bacterium]
MRRHRWLIVFVAVLVVIGAVAIARRGPARVPVDVGTVTRQAQFRSTVSASGEIVAHRYADIGSNVMGKIVSLPVKEGDRVRAGQLLARIDPVQAQSELSSASEQVRALEAEERAAISQVRAATAELAAAEARSRDADQQLARKRSLREQGLLPVSDFDTAKAAADAAAAQLTSARTAVERARLASEAAARRAAQARAQRVSAGDMFSKTSIISPIDGVVSRLRVREGEMVVVGIQNQPGTTLMTISDLEGINAEVKVAEADVLRLALNQRASVTLEALPGRRFEGRVVEIGASALPVTGTGAAAREFKVVVRLSDPDPGLRPGLTCDAEIVTSERTNVLTVPLQSLVLRSSGGSPARTGLFRVVDGRASFVPVSSGVIGGLDVEVGGIAEGTPIIVGPYQALREMNDGTHVKASPARKP